MSEWQPISTAPRDGTRVLLWGFWAGEIHGPDTVPDFLGAGTPTESSDYAGFDWELDGGEAYATWGKPTHWMPLPEPPQ